MRPARLALVLGNLALAVLVVATYGARFGFSHAGETVAYLALGLATLAGWRFLRRRRVTSLLLASLAAWSTLTGLFLVYVTPEVGHGRWMRWWHGVTSVGFLLAFLAHWARNHARLVQLARRLGEGPAGLAAVAGAWGLVLAAGVGSWGTPLRALFSDRLFVPLSTLSFALAAAAVAYGSLLATSPRLERGLADPATRNRLRGAVDASLLASTWLVALTGFPLLYLGRALRVVDAYWLVAGWHVVTSAMLLGLAAGHVALNARPLLAHAR